MKHTIALKIFSAAATIALLAGLLTVLPGRATPISSFPGSCTVSNITTPSDANGTYYLQDPTAHTAEYQQIVGGIQWVILYSAGTWRLQEWIAGTWDLYTHADASGTHTYPASGWSWTAQNWAVGTVSITCGSGGGSGGSSGGAPAVTCPTSASEDKHGTLSFCSASVDVKKNVPAGGTATITEVDLSHYPPLPGQGMYASGVALTILDKNSNPVSAQVEVCFNDPGGSGVIYRWFSTADWLGMFNSTQAGSWLQASTYHTAADQACAHAWVGGIYALQH